jgi:hypothetical protein
MTGPNVLLYAWFSRIIVKTCLIAGPLDVFCDAALGTGDDELEQPLSNALTVPTARQSMSTREKRNKINLFCVERLLF